MSSWARVKFIKVITSDNEKGRMWMELSDQEGRPHEAKIRLKSP